MTEGGDLVGYAVLDRPAECFEYVENECFVGSTVGSAFQFSRQCMESTEDYEIQAVSFRDLLNDCGSSCGKYAMEPTAFNRFKKLAEQIKLDFDTDTRKGFDLVFVEFRTKT